MSVSLLMAVMSFTVALLPAWALCLAREWSSWAVPLVAVPIAGAIILADQVTRW